MIERAGYIFEYHRYDKYEDEDVLELRRYRFFKNGSMLDELWIDWTILFHVWDK